MSQKKDNLFELIQTLSPAEKRYFKAFVNADKQQGSKYLHLFNILSNQKEYDDSKLLREPNYRGNPNRLAVAKNYLYQLILKYLRSNHKNNNPEMEILELLLDTQSLFSRYLHQPAARLVEKAKKMAEENRYYDLLITIGEWERKLAEYKEDTLHYAELYEAVLERETDNAQQLQINTFYFNQYKKMRIINTREGYIKRGKALDEFLACLKYPELQDYAFATNPIAQVYFHFCYIEYFYAMREHHKCYEINCRMMALFEQHPDLASNNPEAYIKCLTSYLLNQLHLGMFEAFDKNKEQLQQVNIPAYGHFLNRLKSFEYLHLQIYRYFSSGLFDKAIAEIIPQVEIYFDQYEHQLIHRDELFLKLEIAWIYLGVQDYEKALEWIIPLQMQIDPRLFTDNYIAFCLLVMMIHYEIGDAKVVSDTAEVMYKYLKSSDKMGSPEAFMIKFFRNASKDLEDKKKQRELLQQLKEQTATLRQYLYIVPIYPIESIIWWIDSLLQNRTMTEVIQENFQSLQQNPKKEMPRRHQTEFSSYPDVIFPDFNPSAN